jgi:RHS repeat-associated protein
LDTFDQVNSESWNESAVTLRAGGAAPVNASSVSTRNDFCGNVLATIAGGVATWNPVRVSSYGPEQSYQASPLLGSTPLADTLVWRSRGIDPGGFYCLGARYYDPVAGHFLSPDPLGHAGSMDLYSFCGGDPLNRFDPDGWCVEDATGIEINRPLGEQLRAYGSGFAEGWTGGAQIDQNYLTLGLSDAYGWTSSGDYQGGIYNWSRGLALVGTGAAYAATGLGVCGVVEAYPTLYVAAGNAAMSPWTPIIICGVASGGYTYSQGGNAQDVLTSIVVSSAAMYASSPFPFSSGGNSQSAFNGTPIPESEEQVIPQVAQMQQQPQAQAQTGAGAAEGIANPIPATLARVIPGEGPFPTLGLPGSADVFVTDAAAIRGMTPAQIAPRLGIPASDTFSVVEFPSAGQSLASPVFRPNPGFIGRGLTSGQAPEFVIPNGPIPPGATTTIIRSP